MACIKCGKATASGAEFCEECLEEMAHYPVNPGTPVILPKRELPTGKHSRKKTLKPEVQVAHLKKAVRGLLALTAILLLLLAAACVMLWQLWDEATVSSLLP